MVDTGADFCVAPKDLAVAARLDWGSLPDATITGIEQGGVTARLGTLGLRIGGVDLEVRCLYLDAPETPFILGRADFLDRFVLTIDQGRGKIVLEEII